VGNPTVGKRTAFRPPFPACFTHAVFLLAASKKGKVIDVKKWICLLLAAVVLALSMAALAEDVHAEATEAPAEAVEAPAERSSWLSEAFEKVGEWKWYTVAVLVALAAFALFMTVGAKRARWNARELASAAMCIAIAFALSSIRLFRAAQGGSITLVSMLPLILYSMAFGPIKGIIVGCAYGLLQLIQDPYVIHPVQLLVDYPLAFAAVSLCCLAKLTKLPARWQLLIAVPLGYFGRFAMSVLSGVVFFAEYAGEEGALLYSVGYNLSYLGPEALLCAALALVPGVYKLVDAMRKRP